MDISKYYFQFQDINLANLMRINKCTKLEQRDRSLGPFIARAMSILEHLSYPLGAQARNVSLKIAGHALKMLQTQLGDNW